MRKPTANKKPNQAALDYHALERENLRLQREVAKLKAQLVSTRHEAAVGHAAPEPELSVESMRQQLAALKAKASRDDNAA